MGKSVFRIAIQFCFLTIVFANNNGFAQARPNIIFILTDDIGYEVPTCNGGKSYSTPNIDQMAQEGMRFTQCHTSPVCSPSRFLFLTGKYNFRNYIEWGKMNPATKTVANVLKGAGYKTLVSGKWQLNGGDISIHKFGFDDYMVWKPYEASTKYFQYKNPIIYENGANLPASETVNKYGEDFFTQKIFDFIDSNKQNPFFIYYPMVLCHKGFSPTPDDADFATWDPAKPRQQRDSIYFPSMVKYMDKKIGQIVDKVKSLGLAENTIIIVSGDNGTPADLTSLFEDGEEVRGGKSTTKEYGTHVPLIISWKGKIAPGTVNNDLVDFTDFLPTFANLANTSLPAYIQPVDGVNFAPALTGTNTDKRQWIYNYFRPYPYNKLIRWAQTTTYKLYKIGGVYTFYNIVADINEQHPLTGSSLTANEIQIWQQLQAVIEGYDAQSPPFLDSLSVSEISDTSVVIGATITSEGGINTVSTKGTLLGTSRELTLRSNPMIDSSGAISQFSQKRIGLQSQTVYFCDAFATNNNGSGVGFEEIKSFKTLSKSVVAQPTIFAAEPGTNRIRLTWNAATFPATGAVKAGYMVVSSTGTPQMKAAPNGMMPRNAILSGTNIQVPNTVLPATPVQFAVQSSLLSNTTYHFLLIPYTWDGKDTATYNYFLANARTKTASTLVPDHLEIATYPNPSAGEFTLVANTPNSDRIEITATDLAGRIVYKSAGPVNQLYKLGKGFLPGLYIVTVRQGAQVSSTEVVIGK